MILFLLSFYVHYDLLNCEEIITAKFNESLLVDHHRQNLLQVNALLQDLEHKLRTLPVPIADDYENDTRREQFIYENILKKHVLRSDISKKDQNNQNLEDTTEPEPAFLPSPQYDPFAPHQGFPPIFPDSYITPKVPKELVKNPEVTPGPHYPEYQLKPKHSMYPGLMMPPSIFPKKDSGHYPFPKHNFGSREQGPNFEPFISHFHLIPLHPFIPPHPSPPSFYVSKFIALQDSTLTTTTRTSTMGANAKIWLQEIAPYTSVKKKMKKASNHQTRPNQKRTTEPPRMTEPRTYGSLIGTANTEQLFSKDEYGFLHLVLPKVDKTPGIIQEEDEKTTAGDVLYGKIKVQKPSTTEAPKQRHLDLMEQLEEGYLIVFVIELFRLIAVKDKREVQQVLAPMETIYNAFSDSGQLAWVDDPLLIFIEKLSTVASEGGDSIDIIRTYSSMMFHSLLKRQEMLSAEVNSIIDHAELFYSVEEGKRLLCSLSDFEDYPNTNKSSYWICEGILENIIHPFGRPSVSRSRDHLLNSVNRALRQRFPLLLRKGIRPQVTYPIKRKRTRHHRKKRRRKRRLRPDYYNQQIYMRH